MWATAFIFSAVHLQFFGFFPRLLMGAFFGYMVLWTGSIWASVFAHALNNSLVVINYWMLASGIIDYDVNGLIYDGSFYSIMVAVISVFATALMIYLINQTSYDRT